MKKLLFILLLLVAIPAYSATYYVDPSGSDSNDGSESAPWATLSHASSVMVGGDTTIINAGTYDGFTTYTSGSENNYITYQAAQGATVTLTSGVYFGYWSSHGPVSFNKLIGVTVPRVWLNGDYDELRDCIVTGPDSTQISGHPSETPPASHCIIAHNTFTANQGSGGSIVNLGRHSSFCIIEDNYFDHNYNYDIFRVFGNGHIIRRNEVVGNDEGGGHADFIQWYDNNGEWAYDFLIENNYVHDGTGSICMILGRESDLRCENWTWRNNIFYKVNGIGQCTQSKFKWYNNLYIESGVSSNGPIFLRGDYNTTGQLATDYNWPHDCEVFNNFFIGCGSYDTPTGNGWYDVLDVTNTDDLNFQADYNYVSTAPADGYRAKDGFNGVEPDGINGGDPKWIDVGSQDYHLQSDSPARNTAKTIDSFNYDYDGICRPQGPAWSRGPYEYDLSGGTDLCAPSGPEPGPTPPPVISMQLYRYGGVLTLYNGHLIGVQQ